MLSTTLIISVVAVVCLAVGLYVKSALDWKSSGEKLEMQGDQSELHNSDIVSS